MTSPKPSSAHPGPIEDKWLNLGQVGRPHGLKGAFYLAGTRTLIPNIYREVVVGPNVKQGLRTHIRLYQVHKQRALLSLAGLDDRTSLEAYVGQTLWAKAPQPRGKERLLGLPVVDVHGLALGHVAAFYNHGASDTVEIVAPSGATLELPFVANYVALPDVTAPALPPTLSLTIAADLVADLWSEPEEAEDG